MQAPTHFRTAGGRDASARAVRRAMRYRERAGTPDASMIFSYAASSDVGPFMKEATGRIEVDCVNFRGSPVTRQYAGLGALADAGVLDVHTGAGTVPVNGEVLVQLIETRGIRVVRA